MDRRHPGSGGSPRAIVVLRPEPGNARTAARVAAAGRVAIRRPLFEVRALAWTAPDPAGFDALLLTSANAVRHAGAGLTRVAELRVIAVGAETARAARAAGLDVAITGDRDAAGAIAAAQAAGYARLLHLAGRERIADAAGTVAVPVYASEVRPVATGDLAGTVVLLHSPRAAAEFARLAEALRATIRLAALSGAVLAAAGDGWEQAQAAAAPDDALLVALAVTLAD